MELALAAADGTAQAWNEVYRHPARRGGGPGTVVEGSDRKPQIRTSEPVTWVFGTYHVRFGTLGKRTQFGSHCACGAVTGTAGRRIAGDFDRLAGSRT